MTYTTKAVADCSTGEAQQVTLTAQEIADLQARDAAWAAAQPSLTLKNQIAALEATMTPRRIREAANGTDNGWMKALDAQILALRTQLTTT